MSKELVAVIDELNPSVAVKVTVKTRLVNNDVSVLGLAVTVKVRESPSHKSHGGIADKVTVNA